MIAGGLLMIALVFVLHHLGVQPSHLATFIVTGAVLAITSAFHTARKQARTELMENDGQVVRSRRDPQPFRSRRRRSSSACRARICSSAACRA